MFDKYPLYEMELKSYHEAKRRLDSQDSFCVYYHNTRIFHDYIINSMFVDNQKAISSAISFLTECLMAKQGWNSKFDFIFIYRGLPNAPFDALVSCISSLLQFSKRILVIAPEISNLSGLLQSISSPFLICADRSTFYSISTVLERNSITGFTLKNSNSIFTVSTVLVSCFCTALDRIVSANSSDINYKSPVYCQFGYPGGFRLLIRLMRNYCRSPNMLWHTTKYNSHVFGDDCNYSSGSRSEGFIYLPTLFCRYPSALRAQYKYKCNSKCIRSNEILVLSSISRPEKLLIDERFATVIRRILELTPECVKYRLYSDQTSSARTFVERVIINAPWLENRLQIFEKFSSNELLNQYESIDLFLDPFPFSAGLTLFRALDLSVPIVSFLGTNHYHNSLNRKFYELLGDRIFEDSSPFVQSIDEYIHRSLRLCGLIISGDLLLGKVISAQDQLFLNICRSSDEGVNDWILSVESSAE